MKVGFHCSGATGLFTGAERFGGMQVRAHLFARGLATRGEHEVRFVIPDVRAPQRRVVDGLEVQELPALIAPVTEAVQKRAERLDRFPWVRVHRWNWRLMTELPLACVAHARFLKHRRQGYWPRLAKQVSRLDVEAWCCFKPGMDTASVVVGARRAGVPVVVMIANDVDLGDHVYEGSRERGPKAMPGHACWRSIMEAEEVVVQTQWQQQRLRERFGREGVLIRNPIDLASHASAAAPLQTPYVLWVGRGDVDHKRPRLCFELARRCPDVRFVMVMNPVSEALQRELAAEAPVNVRVIDWLSYDQIDAYFQHAAVFVSTAAYEGFPNTFLQAGKHGVPIISLAVDPDGFIEGRGCGAVCGGDLGRMQAALEHLLSDEAHRRRCGEAAHGYVREHHGLEGRVHELERLLASVIDRRGRKGHGHGR